MCVCISFLQMLRPIIRKKPSYIPPSLYCVHVLCLSFRRFSIGPEIAFGIINGPREAINDNSLLLLTWRECSWWLKKARKREGDGSLTYIKRSIPNLWNLNPIAKWHMEFIWKMAFLSVLPTINKDWHFGNWFGTFTKVGNTSNKYQHQNNSKRCCTLLQNILSPPYQDLEQAFAASKCDDMKAVKNTFNDMLDKTDVVSLQQKRSKNEINR